MIVGSNGSNENRARLTTRVIAHTDVRDSVRDGRTMV